MKIAGSVGSYGACLHDGSEYSGGYIDTVTEEQLTEWHRPRLIALVEAGIDLFAIETLPALKEALVLCELLKEFPDKKAWITFTCKVRCIMCFYINYLPLMEMTNFFNNLLLSTI